MRPTTRIATILSLSSALFLLPSLSPLAGLVGIGAARAEVLQSQMGLNGSLEADVVKAKADGNILTVAIVLRNGGNERVRVRGVPSEFYFVDAKGANKYLPLRDAKGRWLAGPINQWGKFDFELPANGKSLIWLKFPAPPADSATIDLTTPFTLPFDKLRVQR